MKPEAAAAAALSPLSLIPGSSSRRIAIAVDLSEESGHAVRWAVDHYLRPHDSVVLLHVRPTSVLYGADWGLSPNNNDDDPQQLEDDFEHLTSSRASHLAQPLLDAHIPFKIHIVKDKDLKERLCLEVERLGLCALVMGRRGFGAASTRPGPGRLGTVSDYCVNNCICPVVIVRSPDQDGHNAGYAEPVAVLAKIKTVVAQETDLHPVPEEDQEYLDACDDQHKDDK